MSNNNSLDPTNCNKIPRPSYVVQVQQEKEEFLFIYGNIFYWSLKETFVTQNCFHYSTKFSVNFSSTIIKDHLRTHKLLLNKDAQKQFSRDGKLTMTLGGDVTRTQKSLK